MEENKNYFAKNIKTLRDKYGESQMELAYAIGLDAPATISNYESGTRKPRPEIRKKLASHFRITEYQLMHTDMSDIREISFDTLNDRQTITELSLGVFPVIHSDSAMKNKNFAEGYNAHMRIRQCIIDGKEPSEKDYDICFDSYFRALEDEDLSEAAANMLWWLLQLEYIIVNERISDGAQQLMENSISGTEFLHNYYLKSFEFDEDSRMSGESEQYESEDIHDIDEVVQELLKILLASPNSDIAYYYLALKYVYGLVENEFSQEINSVIGGEMLLNFSKLGNQYAKNYFRMIKKLTR